MRKNNDIDDVNNKYNISYVTLKKKYFVISLFLVSVISITLIASGIFSNIISPIQGQSQPLSQPSTLDSPSYQQQKIQQNQKELEEQQLKQSILQQLQKQAEKKPNKDEKKCNRGEDIALMSDYRDILREKQYCESTISIKINELTMGFSCTDRIKNLKEAIKNADSLPPGDCSCNENQDLVGDECVPKCTGGQTRNPVTNVCQCGFDEIFINGQCIQCSDNQVACQSTTPEQCITEDQNNCGSCGNVCGENEICVDSICTPCSAGLTSCDNICSNLQIDDENCGSCGQACPTGQTCQSGTCCIPDPTTGQCEQTCPPGQEIWNGQCVDKCPSGATRHENGLCHCTGFHQELCNGQCVSIESNANCNGCGKLCQPGTQCDWDFGVGICNPCARGTSPQNCPVMGYVCTPNFESCPPDPCGDNIDNDGDGVVDEDCPPKFDACLWLGNC